jgi:hypothetical protein
VPKRPRQVFPASIIARKPFKQFIKLEVVGGTGIRNSLR